MNKKVLVIIAAIVVVVLIAVGVLVFLPKKASAPSKTTTSTGAVIVATASVNIKDMAFSPATITVKKGTKITWTNQDSVSHTVSPIVGDPGETLANGKTKSLIFAQVGKFPYHCNLHPEMIGYVVVTE
ncbi:MAG: cupredoxin domain-containing protein [Candidatus Saccharibacteria bacterium]|nr:cupredoxin domain-containing protein [Candidatus Saccharibacteria bacterium]